MRKRKTFAGLAVLAFLLIYATTRERRSTTADAIRKELTQTLTPGTSLDSVVEFLNARGLEHSDLERRQAMDVAGHGYPNVPVVVAVQRNTARSVLTREDVDIVFVFDEGSRLSWIDVFPVVTGP